mmetsp:Transcript_10961/g.34885  ORF Transcript_10961/g.34885 Transcript_10961/m.34885 type:complete len:570 (-) Transcript_10961:62-1771(-)
MKSVDESAAQLDGNASDIAKPHEALEAPADEEELVIGGRFLQAYRKLNGRLGDICAAHPPLRCRSAPIEEQCGPTVPCWESHSFAYVLGAHSDIAYEIAAALSQFEPVSVIVDSAAQWDLARRSLPDHIRIVLLASPPEMWTAVALFSFVRGPCGDTRLIEFCGESSRPARAPSAFEQIAQVERLFRYTGPKLSIGERSSHSIDTPFVDTDGRHRARLQDGVAETVRQYSRGLTTNVDLPNTRLIPNNSILVGREMPQVKVSELEGMFSNVYRIESRYLGYFVANGGVLVPAFGDSEADLKALKILQFIFPDRRMIQIIAPSPTLNINSYVIGIPGNTVKQLPGSTFSSFKAAREAFINQEAAHIQSQLGEEDKSSDLATEDHPHLRDSHDQASPAHGNADGDHHNFRCSSFMSTHSGKSHRSLRYSRGSEQPGESDSRPGSPSHRVQRTEFSGHLTSSSRPASPMLRQSSEQDLRSSRSSHHSASSHQRDPKHSSYSRSESRGDPQRSASHYSSNSAEHPGKLGFDSPVIFSDDEDPHTTDADPNQNFTFTSPPVVKKGGFGFGRNKK